MSKHAVSFVIHSLMTDRDLRDRFARSPIEALMALYLSADIDLTLNDVEGLIQAGPDVWRSTLAQPTVH